ncbi:MAG: hypothetical protein HC908_07755 [Calothrix sp. SM1_7_51]|nr:hypothetical protein [Calothrix sp. SM1_7_51]
MVSDTTKLTGQITGQNFFVDKKPVVNTNSTILKLGSNWRIEGTADYNGDGKEDLLWRDYSSDGANAIWTMNGPTLIKGYFIESLKDFNWVIRFP